MLGKLIKHEFRATGRIILPMLGAVLVLSPFAGLVIAGFDKESFEGVFKFLGGIFVGLFFMAVAAICITSFIIMIRRFYSNLLRDEGYLMFTLPVSTHALVWSKLIVSFVWFVVTAAASAIFMVIVAMVSYAVPDLSSVRLFVNDIVTLVGGWNIVLYTIEGVICLFLVSCSVCLHFYGAMALGHSFSSHRMLLSICFYVALEIAVTWLFFLAMQLFRYNLLDSLSNMLNTWVDGMTLQREYVMVPHIMFFAAGLYFAVISALYYIPTILPLKKCLNIS